MYYRKELCRFVRFFLRFDKKIMFLIFSWSFVKVISSYKNILFLFIYFCELDLIVFLCYSNMNVVSRMREINIFRYMCL